MSKDDPVPPITEPRRSEDNVSPIRRARWCDVAAAVPPTAQPRETSWRDLVRRLKKNLAKR